MKVVITTDEIRAFMFVGNGIPGFFGKHASKLLLSDDAIEAKVLKSAQKMSEQTDAIKISFSDTAKEINSNTSKELTIDISSDFLIDLTKAFGNLINAIVSLIVGSENTFDAIFAKYTKPDYIEKEAQNVKDKKIKELEAELKKLKPSTDEE